MRFGWPGIALVASMGWAGACTVNVDRFQVTATSSSTSSDGGGGGDPGAGGAGGTGGEPPVPPSCEGATPGAGRDCGLDGDEDCCGSLLVSVEPMTYYRAYNACSAQVELNELTATVSPFRLDAFEVTVGRFRRFFDAFPSWSQQVEPGFGARPNLPGSGWPEGATLPDLNAELNCPNGTWVAQTGVDSEQRAINCVSWEAAFLFCIWDGGYLPTEAEWNFAAAGGNEIRRYPWGDASPTDGLRAVYTCLDDDMNGESDTFPGELCPATPDGPEPVGGKPAGDGRWGHHDLAGNVSEWTMDFTRVMGGTNSPVCELPSPCTDCARLVDPAAGNGGWRVHRGGAYDAEKTLEADLRRARRSENFQVGLRCMRRP